MITKSHESTANMVIPSVTEAASDSIASDSMLFKPLCQIRRNGVLINACFALEIRGVGCIVRTFIREDDQIAEALTFVAGVKIVKENGELKLQNANP